MMRTLWCFVAVMILAMPAMGQERKGDEAELEKIIKEYTRLEAEGGIQAQSQYIAPDRMWMGLGGRRTDNATWVKIQEGYNAEAAKAFPGIKFYYELRDLHIRLIADDVAVTNFTWYINRIIPGNLSPEQVEALGRSPIPTVASLVWVKRNNAWKIVNSHFSNLYFR